MKKAGALLLLMLAVSAAVVTSRWNEIQLDGVGDDLFGLLVSDEDTQYSGGYSSTKFRTVEKGMSRAEVEALLGPPLLVEGPFGESKETTLYYSRSQKTGTYRVRSLLLKRDVVERIHSGLWID